MLYATIVRHNGRTRPFCPMSFPRALNSGLVSIRFLTAAGSLRNTDTYLETEAGVFKVSSTIFLQPVS